MFTGIVEDTARLVSVTPAAGGVVRVRLAPKAIQAGDLNLGASIAVDGCCLTVVERDAEAFELEANPETLARTTLGTKGPDDLLNLERPLAMGDRLGGHLVTGHVDATGALVARRSAGEAAEVDFSYPPDLAPYLVDKGSVAVDGISLTTYNVTGDQFTVYLIPFTLEVTTLGTLPVGGPVNLETDLLGKYVVRALALRRGEDPGPVD